MEGLLTLVRHGQSVWNAENRFTGWMDPPLTPRGEEEARSAGQKLKEKGFVFDAVFCSDLLRAQRTCSLILEELGEPGQAVQHSAALKERNYGILAGLNKNQAQERWGAEMIRTWRRSYDVAPPEGESLKDTAARIVPFYQQNILPLIRQGKKVLLVAHGNSLRALIMELEKYSPDEILNVEIKTSEVLMYRFDKDILTRKENV